MYVARLSEILLKQARSWSVDWWLLPPLLSERTHLCWVRVCVILGVSLLAYSPAVATAAIVLLDVKA